MYHDYPNIHFATFHGFARELFGPKGTLDEVEQVLLTHLIDNRPLPYSPFDKWMKLKTLKPTGSNF